MNNHETVCVPRPYNKATNRMMFKLQSSHHVMERNVFKPQQKTNTSFQQQGRNTNRFTRTGRKQYQQPGQQYHKNPGSFRNTSQGHQKGRQSMTDLFFNRNDFRKERFGSKENLFNDLVQAPSVSNNLVEPSRNFGTSLTNRGGPNTVLSDLVHKKSLFNTRGSYDENSFGNLFTQPSSLAMAKNIVTHKAKVQKQPLLNSALFNSKDILSIPIRKKNEAKQRAPQQKQIKKRKNVIQQATVPHILVQTGATQQTQAQKVRKQKFRNNQMVQQFKAENSNTQNHIQKQTRRKFGNNHRASNSIERSQSFERT